MKIISYSLFRGPDPLAELFYVRGFFFNVLINSIVYPDWKTLVHIDRYIDEKYYNLFKLLIIDHGIRVVIEDGDATHCMKMLWRMKPIFWPDVEYVICRDTDALTSMREADAVNKFVSYSGVAIHGISDNRAHSIPLMGGMSGFRCQAMRDKYESFDQMIALGNGIDKHGSDQKFLNDVVYKDFSNDMMMQFGESSKHLEDKWLWHVANDLGPRSHPSDLCTSFIGAAGCNEMETLRYLRLAGILKVDSNIALVYPKIFYFA